jgi:hypothetical protein
MGSSGWYLWLIYPLTLSYDPQTIFKLKNTSRSCAFAALEHIKPPIGVDVIFEGYSSMETTPGHTRLCHDYKWRNGIQIRLRETFEDEAECVRSPDMRKLKRQCYVVTHCIIPQKWPTDSIGQLNVRRNKQRRSKPGQYGMDRTLSKTDKQLLY